jgi:hypothetical protein
MCNKSSTAALANRSIVTPLSRVHTFGQTFVKHSKYPTNMFVKYLFGIDVFPNNFVCQCPKQNCSLIIRTLWHSFYEKQNDFILINVYLLFIICNIHLGLGLIFKIVMIRFTKRQKS